MTSLQIIEDKNSLFGATSALITDVCDKYHIDYEIVTGLKTQKPTLFSIGFLRTIELEDNPENTNLSAGIKVLSTLDHNDVLYIKGSNRFAYFGELMGMYCQRSNVSSVIIDGCTRDTKTFTNYSYPIYYRAATPLDIAGRGRVKNGDKPIYVGHTIFQSGDAVFSDKDACVFIKSHNYRFVVKEAEKELTIERTVKDKIRHNWKIEDIIRTTKQL